MRTPPILQKDITTLAPVISSNTSRTFSRIRQQCMNRESNPNASARRPSQRRWLWTLESSRKMTLRYLALSGISISMRPSMAPV